MLKDDSDEREVVQIDEDTETLAHILTLIMAGINPNINKGETYEIVVGLVVQMIYEPIYSSDIEECAHDLVQKILETQRVANSKRYPN